MDRLEQMFEQQKYLQEYLARYKPDAACIPGADEEEKFKNMILLLIKECTEVLDEINFKPHKLSKIKVNKDKIAEELVDVLKYWMNLALLTGLDTDDIYAMFIKKSSIVLERFKEELKNAKKGHGQVNN